MNHPYTFFDRHAGLDANSLKAMLALLGVESEEALANQIVPADIRLAKQLNLPEAMSESGFLSHFRKVAAQNKVFRNFIGQGYYGTITPAVIQRNILENPGWYTAYTPYQAEIAQGRMEMLINFQTLVTDLTGMDIANASLLDEATAAAEAMNLLWGQRKGDKDKATVLLVDEDVFPQTKAVLETRAEPVGITIRYVALSEAELSADVFAVLAQYPGNSGRVTDWSGLVKSANTKGIGTIIGSDLLALVSLAAPGLCGTDVVYGSAQRFGVPMGFGGPHAGFFAVNEKFKRFIPGRLIGVSKDASGKLAYRMSLQTREQHIRREKATSNICTAQVLLSVMAAAYAVYHGPEGLAKIASTVHANAQKLEAQLAALGWQQKNEVYFDTLCYEVKNSASLKAALEEASINVRFEGNTICISVDQTTSHEDLEALCAVVASFKSSATSVTFKGIPEGLKRNTPYLTHPVFSLYRTEHGLLRYLKQLENKDLSMVHGMIALGSCTMKLNATTEMIPVTWPEWNQLHPFCPSNQAEGYHQVVHQLSEYLCEVTGFSGISLQPNSGAQGEYAGLMVIRAYHRSRGDAHRNIALIPASAHGTNPASAVMAGMEVVVTPCDEKGNIDIDALRILAEKHQASLSCLMVTYPSTHGVYEEGIREICAMIHSFGGQVYMDGANMNAQVGLTSPANIGADVCHLNLHKTFCIPHGGGGPGVGPIGVAAHLVPFLPGHPTLQSSPTAIHPVSAAPYGSASILVISYAYIRLMGAKGLANSTRRALLNANYMKKRLEAYYPVLYTGKNGFCAHEFILDCRGFKASAGIEVEDIAKRLMDYGFHAPTVSFPVAGTLMIEPTESENKEELDRFCEAMIQIREEIEEIEKGIYSRTENVLKMAPHQAETIMADVWSRSYSREKAAYPLPSLRGNKYWPPVSRIDNAYGDRNLFCACIPLAAYAEQEA